MIYCDVKGEGPALLFVHGWAMTGKFWQKQTEKLAEHFKVVAMDLRSHGNSSKVLDGHTLPQYAKDVRSVIETLKLGDVTLIGWSLGGPVVLAYWKQFGKDKLKALGLVDMTPFPFSPADWNTHALRNYNHVQLNVFLTALRENRRDVATTFINNMFRSGQAPDEDMKWMMEEHLKTPTPVAAAIYSDYVMRDYTGTLKTIEVPTIVLAANSNIFKAGIAMGKHVAGQIPKAKFVAFEKSGHMPFYEEPEKFNTSLEEFINKIN